MLLAKFFRLWRKDPGKETALRDRRAGISYQIVDNYYKNKVVRYDSDVLNRMCEALSCDISDLLRYTKEDP